jgi:hypothetical protein
VLPHEISCPCSFSQRRRGGQDFARIQEQVDPPECGRWTDEIYSSLSVAEKAPFPSEDAPHTTLEAVSVEAPQTTLNPVAVLAPQTTELPHTTELPDTLAPQTTDEPQTTDDPQTTEDEATLPLPLEIDTLPFQEL